MLCIRDTGGLAAGDWSWLRVITLTWRHHIDGSYLTRSNTVYLVGLSEKFRESKLGEWSLGTQKKMRGKAVRNKKPRINKSGTWREEKGGTWETPVALSQASGYGRQSRKTQTQAMQVSS